MGCEPGRTVVVCAERCLSSASVRLRQRREDRARQSHRDVKASNNLPSSTLSISKVQMPGRSALEELLEHRWKRCVFSHK